MQRMIMFWSILVVLGCRQAETQTVNWEPVPQGAFSHYWHSGQAELNRFELIHARYGELRTGDAVLVFVTEDFRTDKWVKLDDYNGDGKSKAVPILKVNLAYQFNTGIYPYSILSSVFTPLDLQQFPHSIKTSTSVQEWCGHVYTQMVFKSDTFHVTSHSYFEREADQEFNLKAALLEDEVWSRIRVSPQSLPVGPVDVIPGLKYARLLHRTPAVEKATASLKDTGDGMLTYTLRYTSFDRSLSIRFKKAFPYEIEAFEETYKDGFGANARPLTTTGRRTHSLKTDYWRRNAVADSTFRSQLGLE